MYRNWLRATRTLTTQRQTVIWFKNKLEKIHGTFTARNSSRCIGSIQKKSKLGAFNSHLRKATIIPHKV